MAQKIPKPSSLDELHGDERRSFDFVDLKDGDDVRMVERGGGSCFAFETAKVVGSARQGFLKNLDRHVSSELRVVCAVDGPHSTRAYLSADFERGDSCARRDLHIRMDGVYVREAEDARAFWGIGGGGYRVTAG